VIDRELVED